MELLRVVFSLLVISTSVHGAWLFAGLSPVYTTTDQDIAGIKTFKFSDTNLVKIDPAHPVGLNTGATGSVSVFADTDGGMAINMTNLSTGPNATAIMGFGNSFANGRLGIGTTGLNYTGNQMGGADSSVWVSDSLVSFFQNDQPEAPFIWAGGTSREELMRLTGLDGASKEGTFTLTGGHATERLTINPQINKFFDQLRSVNATMLMRMKNSSAGSSAFNQINIESDTGSLSFGVSSSTASSGAFQTDAAYMTVTSGNGYMIWSQNGSLRILTGGSTTPRIQIDTDGQIKMPLSNYADDAAAGAAGIRTGSLYQTSGTVKIKQ